MEIRAARPEEAPALTELALRSKAHWGYSAEFLASVRPELTLSPDVMADAVVLVGEVDGRVVGFAVVEGEPPEEGELGHLWVDPSAIGTGVGRGLWERALDTARAAGFSSLLISSDPNAEGFYLAMGAELIGKVASGTIAGRMLPLLRVSLGT